MFYYITTAINSDQWVEGKTIKERNLRDNNI